MFYTFIPSFIRFFYTLFILFISLHHDIELSAQSDVNNNRFATLGDHASFPQPNAAAVSKLWVEPGIPNAQPTQRIN